MNKPTIWQDLRIIIGCLFLWLATLILPADCLESQIILRHIASACRLAKHVVR